MRARQQQLDGCERWSDATEEAKRRKEAQIARRERCKTLTGREVTDSEPLPFDIAKANELYQALFGQVEDLLKNPDGTFRQLLVVPSGPLTQLPFQVLVTGKPEDAKMAGYANAAWLIRRHAITVLPSVASLEALRQNAKTSRATKPLIGFGNPLLDGNPEKPWQVEAAHKAREKERCPEAKQQVANLLSRGRRRGTRSTNKKVSPTLRLYASKRRCLRRRTSYAPSQAISACPATRLDLVAEPRNAKSKR